MAEFKFNCPNCNAEFTVDESLVGRRAECSECKNELCIPSPSEKTTLVLEANKQQAHEIFCGKCGKAILSNSQFCGNCGNPILKDEGQKAVQRPVYTAQHFTNEATSTEWYQNPTVVTLFLFFFSPIGLFLMWKYSVFSKSLRILSTIVFGTILIFSIFVFIRQLVN